MEARKHIVRRAAQNVLPARLMMLMMPPLWASEEDGFAVLRHQQVLLVAEGVVGIVPADLSRSVAFASLRSSCVRMPEKSVSSSSSFVTPSAITKRSAYSCSLGSRPMKAHFVGVTT